MRGVGFCLSETLQIGYELMNRHGTRTDEIIRKNWPTSIGGLSNSVCSDYK